MSTRQSPRLQQRAVSIIDPAGRQHQQQQQQPQQQQPQQQPLQPPPLQGAQMLQNNMLQNGGPERRTKPTLPKSLTLEKDTT